jgi:adenine-specific DNA-methyltransferase
MTEPKRMDLKSMSITEDQKEKLKQLFPEVFTEGKIDFDKLKLSLGQEIDPGNELYGMTWPGKSECFRIIQESSIASLRPHQDQSINWDDTENVFIEGDNLEVLKLMQKAYYGKIKMIAIDPPYNTGKEFIYPDNYSESLDTYLEYSGQTDGSGLKFSSNVEGNGRFHSKWLNMMYPRLFLARNLLREDGVIFICIDDNENRNLRYLCDEIFGEDNFLANIVWQHSVQPKGYTDIFSVHHNHVLCYRKSEAFEVSPVARTEADNKHYSNPDDDPNGDWRSGDVRNALYRPNLIYNITTPSGGSITPPSNGWRWSKATMQEKIDSGEIVFSEDETRIIRKIYLKNQTGRAPETIWFAEDVGSTRKASQDLKTLFDGQVPFDTAKPIALLQRMIHIAGVEDGDTVLDFFSGAGSLGEAAFRMQDEVKCTFILVQLPEVINDQTPHGKTAVGLGFNTVADIAKARLVASIKDLQDSSQETPLLADSACKLGFRVFSLAPSHFAVWSGSVDDEKSLEKQIELAIEHIDPNSDAHDILYELLLKSGFELTTSVVDLTLAEKQVHSVASNALLVCLDRELNKDVITEMAKLQPARVICLDAGFAGNDQLKTNAVQIMKSHGVEDFRTV